MSKIQTNVYNNTKKGFLPMHKTFNIVIYKDAETNSYWATCPVLQGCNTQGDTIEEVKENMKEAIELYLEDYEPKDIIEDTVTLEVVNA